MDLQVRLLAERAGTRRLSLLGLIEVIPEDLWSRREPGEEWTARNHLEHVATADVLLRETVQAAMQGAQLATSYAERRAAVMAAVAGSGLTALRERMAAERASSLALLEEMEVGCLDAPIIIPGAADAFGHNVAWPLRAIVTAWAEHDTGHELAIRAAITAPPDAASLAAAARFRR